jgi:hypothetical protein
MLYYNGFLLCANLLILSFDIRFFIVPLYPNGCKAVLYLKSKQKVHVCNIVKQKKEK